MILINGEEAQVIDASDRGLHYGDGLFETVAVVDGQAPLWPRHMARLAEGCSRLGIPMPDSAKLAAEARRLYDGHQRAVLKLIITRGNGGRGYRPPRPGVPTRLVQIGPWPDYPTAHWHEGVRVRLCSTRLSSPSPLAGVKHLNRLEQVLARQEWYDSTIAEGLMLDADGFVVEGTMTNVFMVKDGRLVTPELSRCGVAGVMRALVLEVGTALGLDIEIGRIEIDDLLNAGEVFLTNSLIGLWPVQELAGRRFDIPAPVSGRLRTALREEGVAW